VHYALPAAHPFNFHPNPQESLHSVTPTQAKRPMPHFAFDAEQK
jgi:hypothetical protein